MEKRDGKRIRRLAAVLLAFALLAGGCAGPEQPSASSLDTDRSASAEPADLEAETRRAAILDEAEQKLNEYRWPRETVQKEILGQEMEFVLYHGNGWTVYAPASWVGGYPAPWESPSRCAGFDVGKWFLGVNNPKIYRARQGSWRHETNYDPPFDYYYDNDGGYTPPAGSADYLYFFAPDGEGQSYELTLSRVVGEITEEEKAIQEAMLLSFSLDRDSHILRCETYETGKTEWDAAFAGLVAEAEPIWFHLDDNDGVWNDILDGKRDPDYLSYALALGDYSSEGFIQTFFGERPERAPEPGCDMITLCLPEMNVWLYFFDASPWVQISHAKEEFWGRFQHKDNPDNLIFDTVRAWMEAEQGWADS